MSFYADLHIHSKYSRATSKDCDLEHLAYWACKKGIDVVGTGDFTHPAWRAELEDKLVPAEPGLFRLRDDVEREVSRRLNGACRGGGTRFMLSVEISTIYKRPIDDKTRKVHHLLYAPDFATAGEMVARLDRIGNLTADGRPILGLDSRHLLEIVLESGPGGYLVPAHVWTPWFSVLGSKSGFDRVTDCYGDLAGHIFAIETGLSSDPEMNWRLSHLDRYTLVSNSDAHSPAKLGREATLFTCQRDYFSIRRALETRRGFAGTVEFFPEEGKYHLDGHRKCGVVMEPETTREHDGRCPVCGKGLTVGVMHRVQELADRPAGFRPEGASPYRCLVPLPEVIGELVGTGSGSKTVARNYEELLARLGSEYFILERAPIEDIEREGSPQIAEAVTRMRAGRVIRTPGYDGEYGVIHLFEDGEISRPGRLGRASGRTATQALHLPGFEPAQAATPPIAEPTAGRSGEPPRVSEPPRMSVATHPASHDGVPEPAADPSTERAQRQRDFLAALDREQRAAASVIEGPLLIVAGPGTGKTRTLTRRVASLVADHGARAESCLCVTFTNRAAGELRERLVELLPDVGERIPVATFHGLGLSILRENREACGLPRGFRIAGDGERLTVLGRALGVGATRAKRLLAAISRVTRGGHADAEAAAIGPELEAARAAYRDALEREALIDFDDLLRMPVQLLGAHPEVRQAYRRHYAWISIDEYQDIDELQYQLVRLLCPDTGNLCAIGDPDQAIYRFRGADVGFFMRFCDDFPGARVVHLHRNYRSTRTIVEGALGAIAPASLVAGRRLVAVDRPGNTSGPRVAPIHVRALASDRGEAEFVVATIERLMGGTSFFSLDSGRVDPDSASAEPGESGEFDFDDFAVLYRTGAQTPALVEALHRSSIPFQKRSHDKLADRPGVAELARSVAERATSGERTPVIQLLSDAADATEDATTGAVDLLVPLAERAGQDVERFLAELACGVEVDTWDPRAGRVSLLTLHAAKGLEFRVVFIVGCEDGLVPLRWGPVPAESPTSSPAGRIDELAEERRLLFVGMTRARERLYLTRARKRLWRGQLRELPPCPFVDDIATELIARGPATIPGRTAGKRPRSGKHRQLPLW